MENLKREIKLNGSSIVTSANQGQTAGTHPDVGLRFHTEEVTLVGVTPGDTDNAIGVYLANKFPAGAILKDAWIYSSSVAVNADGDADLAVNLQLSAAGDTAVGSAVSTGTEVIGAGDGAGAASLRMDEDDTAGAVVQRIGYNTAVATKVFAAICIDEADTTSTNTILTSGTITVCFSYFGLPMVAV